MISDTLKQRVENSVIAFGSGIFIFLLVTFGYGFLIGVIDARGVPESVPARCVGIFFWPENNIYKPPVFRAWMAFANNSGYDLAGGPK